MKKVKVFAPSSVSNVACGFDVFGFAINNLGDTVEAYFNDGEGIIIESITGVDNLPFDPAINLTAIAARSVLDAMDIKRGITFNIHKTVLPGSGLGSSASAAVAGVMAVNELLGKPLTKEQLLPHAGKAEQFASNQLHYDNVAPAMLGGFTIVRCSDPLDVVSIPYPKDLWVFIIHPQIEIKTKDAKHMLGRTMSISNAVIQFGNIAGLTAGLIQGDYDLISRSLVDVLAEPVRSKLIPRYDELKSAVLNSGALGCNISGSGPSIFCLCHGEAMVEPIKQAAMKVYDKDNNVNFYKSSINPNGAVVI